MQRKKAGLGKKNSELPLAKKIGSALYQKKEKRKKKKCLETLGSLGKKGGKRFQSRGGKLPWGAEAMGKALKAKEKNGERTRNYP